MIRILAISGSLRAASLNTAILRVLAQRAKTPVEVVLFEGLGEIPLFNPDVEDQPFVAVLKLRAAIMSADAVLISSPEYAHGVTGVIKNALDWIVGSAELDKKPVAVLSALSRSEYAPRALRETLEIMGGKVVGSACLMMPRISNSTTVEQAAAMPDLVAVLDRVLAELVAAI